MGVSKNRKKHKAKAELRGRIRKERRTKFQNTILALQERFIAERRAMFKEKIEEAVEELKKDKQHGTNIENTTEPIINSVIQDISVAQEPERSPTII